jgi:hypothetical protein
MGASLLGLKDVQAGLKEEFAQVKADVRAKVKDAAELLARDAQARVPVRTGYLRDSMKVVNAGTRRGIIRFRVVYKAAYADEVHEGRTTKGGKVVRRQPWLRQATEALATAMEAQLARALKR